MQWSYKTIDGEDRIKNNNSILVHKKLPEKLMLEDFNNAEKYSLYKDSFAKEIAELHEKFCLMDLSLDKSLTTGKKSANDLYKILAKALENNTPLLTTHKKHIILETPWFDIDLNDLNDLKSAIDKKGQIYLGLLFAVVLNKPLFSLTVFYNNCSKNIKTQINRIGISLREIIVLDNQFKIDKSEFIKNNSGLEGYMKFADKYFNGQMLSAYMTLSALFRGGDKLKDSLKWPGCITCDTKMLRELKKLGLEKLQKDYHDLDGYMKFADKYFNGQMLSAYKTLSALFKNTDDKLKNSLKWPGQITCDTKMLGELKKLGLDKLQKDYHDLDGYMKFADKYFNGQMKSAYVTLSALFKNTDDKLKDSLKWPGCITCDTKMLGELKKLGLDKLQKDYHNLEGYMKFADKYFNGQMLSAYVTLSALFRGGDKLKDSFQWPGQITCDTKMLENIKKALPQNKEDFYKKALNANLPKYQLLFFYSDEDIANNQWLWEIKYQGCRCAAKINGKLIEFDSRVEMTLALLLVEWGIIEEIIPGKTGSKSIANFQVIINGDRKHQVDFVLHDLKILFEFHPVFWAEKHNSSYPEYVIERTEMKNNIPEFSGYKMYVARTIPGIYQTLVKTLKEKYPKNKKLQQIDQNSFQKIFNNKYNQSYEMEEQANLENN